MFYDFFDTGLIGALTLVADEKGLRQIIFPNRYHRENIPAAWQRQPVFFKEIKRQLRAYFAGELTNFDLTIAPQGTDFQQAVWRALQKIPYGEVVSYKKIAEAIGNPKAVRAVGSANGKNPIPIIIPCHRVIGSNGKLTGFAGGLKTKEQLIQLEKDNSW